MVLSLYLYAPGLLNNSILSTEYFCCYPDGFLYFEMSSIADLFYDYISPTVV